MTGSAANLMAVGFIETMAGHRVYYSDWLIASAPIALVPRKVARTLSRERRLRLIEIAFPRKQIFIDAFWSPVIDSRRGRVWFRQILARAATELS